MKLTITAAGPHPRLVAALIRAQAEEKLGPLRKSLRHDGLVYVRAHVRVGPPAWFKDPEQRARRTEQLFIWRRAATKETA